MHVDVVPPTPLTQSERQTVYRLFTDEHIARPYHTSHHISAEHEKNYHEAHFTVHNLLRKKGARFKTYRLKK